jgi:exopolysaccharide biosynthesis protein
MEQMANIIAVVRLQLMFLACSVTDYQRYKNTEFASKIRSSLHLNIEKVGLYASQRFESSEEGPDGNARLRGESGGDIRSFNTDSSEEATRLDRGSPEFGRTPLG